MEEGFIKILKLFLLMTISQIKIIKLFMDLIAFFQEDFLFQERLEILKLNFKNMVEIQKLSFVILT